MRKGRDGGKREKKTGGKKEKRRMKIVATTSLPAVDRPNADRWNAARWRQLTDQFPCIKFQKKISQQKCLKQY